MRIFKAGTASDWPGRVVLDPTFTYIYYENFPDTQPARPGRLADEVELQHLIKHYNWMECDPDLEMDEGL